MSNSVSTSINSYEQFEEGELRLRDDKKMDIGSFNNEISSESILNNFPVITGYYGVVLRKKKHPLFGSYWSKEYCLLQSNIFVCHELKYPYKIKKCVSVASISKCEISRMDPCIYCLVVNNNSNRDDQVGKSEVSGKRCFSCFNLKSGNFEIIKIKCKSVLDTQKWTFHINNTVKNWKLNKINVKSLYNANQFIEKTLAHELFEKMNRKLKKVALQASIHNMIWIFKQVEQRNLYISFYRMIINSITKINNEMYSESILSSSNSSTSNSVVSSEESTFKRDLLLIKRRIILFKVEQGSNHLKRFIARRMSEYWKLFVNNIKDSSTSSFGESDCMEIHYKLILKRRIFLFWRELLRIILLKDKNKQKYRKSVDSVISTGSVPYYNADDTAFHSNQSSPPK